MNPALKFIKCDHNQSSFGDEFQRRKHSFKVNGYYLVEKMNVTMFIINILRDLFNTRYNYNV